MGDYAFTIKVATRTSLIKRIRVLYHQYDYSNSLSFSKQIWLNFLEAELLWLASKFREKSKLLRLFTFSLKRCTRKFQVAVVQKTAKKGNRERGNAHTDFLLFAIIFFHVFVAAVIIIRVIYGKFASKMI